jgi:hypothetical protein
MWTSSDTSRAETAVQFAVPIPTERGLRTAITVQREAQMTVEQEKQVEFLDAEIQIAEKQLRVTEVKKRIAETELDIVGLQQTLQQQLKDEIPAL